MTFAGEHYYNIIRFLLTVFGLWPYQKSGVFRTTFIFCAFIFFAIFQLMTFLTRKCTFEFVIRKLSFIILIVANLILNTFFYLNLDRIRELLEQIQIDWNTMKNESEIKILEKYSFQSYLFLVFLFFLIIVFVIGFLIMEMQPVILDIFAPLNESRPRNIIMDIELFINEKQYFYIYLIVEIGLLALSLLDFYSIGSLLYMYIRHSCATYKIASGLMENIVTKNLLEIPSNQKVYVMRQTVSRAVHIHRTSKQFPKLFTSYGHIWFFVLTILCILSLSCCLFHFFNAATLMKEISEIVIIFLVLMIHFILMFIATLSGQSLIDHSTELFYAPYKARWYLAPLPIQKLLLFTMQHTIKANTIIFGNVFISSLEGYTKIITSSISYFTVMRNLLQGF